MTSRVKAGSGAVDKQTQDVSITVHTVETRVTPEVASEAQALLLAVLCAVPARPASSKGVFLCTCLQPIMLVPHAFPLAAHE